MKLLKNIFFIALVALALAIVHTKLNKHLLTKRNQKTINTLFELAKQTRPAAFGEPQQEPFLEIAKQIESTLPDYTKDNDINKTIIHFLDKTLEIKITDQQIQQVPAGPAGGFSGNLIFFINDKNKKPFLVVKIFKDPYNAESFGGFVMEASAFDIASTFPNKELNCISIKSVGKCTIDTKDFAIMALSLAPGINLHDYIIQIIPCPQESALRIETFNKVQKSMYKFGKALAELHTTHIGSKNTLHPAFKKYILKSYRKMLKRLQKDNPGINISRFKTCFNSLLDKVENQKVVRSFAYGDAHLGNFLYEPQTGTMTIIDLASLHLSADRNGNPISTAALDYSRIPDTFSIYTRFGLTQNESDTLMKAFRKGYQDNNGTVPTQLEMTFFKLFNDVWLTGFLLKQIEKKSAFVDEGFKKVTEYNIEQIKKTIENYEKNS
jgi:hypothetical protein